MPAQHTASSFPRNTVPSGGSKGRQGALAPIFELAPFPPFETFRLALQFIFTVIDLIHSLRAEKFLKTSNVLFCYCRGGDLSETATS